MGIFDMDYLSIKQNSISGRYVTYDHISSLLIDLPENIIVAPLGHSVNGIPIESITLGSGATKVLMWSQMHGNESTTTKSVFDLINFLDTKTKLARTIADNCTITIIPMLNPDGAKAYTRVNANNVDLNRDAQDRSQPESNLLRACYEEFKPDFCFNLHDQRTIFNVGKTPEPATVSFLAPAHDEQRSISHTRALSIRLIAAMNERLQEVIPGRVGRYDDTFNANCVGDTFQMLNTPTILFESGHSPGDYERENTREYIFQALVAALTCIAEDQIGAHKKEAYFNIPENEKLFYDILIKNAHFIDAQKYAKESDIGILFKEVLVKDVIEFEPSIEKMGTLNGFYGHKTFDCSLTDDLNAINKSSFFNLL